jgi:hypothetical protein
MTNFEKKQNLKSYPFYFFKKYITIENQWDFSMFFFVYIIYALLIILIFKVTICRW